MRRTGFQAAFGKSKRIGSLKTSPSLIIRFQAAPKYTRFARFTLHNTS